MIPLHHPCLLLFTPPPKKGISIVSAVFAQITHVTNTQTDTLRQDMRKSSPTLATTRLKYKESTNLTLRSLVI